MNYLMKRKAEAVLLSLAVLCILVLLVSDAQGAVIMKKDGTALSGAFEPEQSITLMTPKGESSVKLSDIRWMAGGNLMKLRVSGTKDLLSGTIREAELIIQKIDKNKKKPISISTSEIAFLFADDADLEKTEEIRIEESGGNMRVMLYSKAKRKAKLEITLLPENWDADIQITKPTYPERTGSRDEFKVGLLLEASPATKTVVDKMLSEPKAEGLTLCLDYIFQGGKSWVSSPLDAKLERDKAAAVESYKQELTHSFGKPFYMDMGSMGTHETTGSGYLNLYIQSGKEHLASGQLEITKTLSNVLHLPITIEKR